MFWIYLTNLLKPFVPLHLVPNYPVIHFSDWFDYLREKNETKPPETSFYSSEKGDELTQRKLFQKMESGKINRKYLYLFPIHLLPLRGRKVARA